MTSLRKVDSFSRVNAKVYGSPDKELIKVPMLVSRSQIRELRNSLREEIASNPQADNSTFQAMVDALSHELAPPRRAGRG